MTPALNTFTSSCYQQLAGRDGNLIPSPFNLPTALSMALAGARGHTAEQMEAVLGIHYDSFYDAAFGSLPASLSATGNAGDSQLHTANAFGRKRDLRRPEQRVVFCADHAFIFLIRERSLGVILLIGRLIKPPVLG